MKTNRFLLLATLLFLTTANATTIAVLEITIVNDEMDLTIEETKFLSDELRRHSGTYLVLAYKFRERCPPMSLPIVANRGFQRTLAR